MATARISHKFTVGPVDNGRWLAVSSCAPYFAFEGENQEEVCATANRALDFYYGLSGKLDNHPSRERTKSYSTFSARKVVEKEGCDA